MTRQLEKRKPRLALEQIEDLARGLGERGKDLWQEFFPGEES
ncbi:hypothetical protein [Chloracidobacterium thermophilum]|nr:hypothetical protein [Chloracidobacterium thermophilum]